MKSRDSLIRHRKFQADDKRRRTMQIESMISEFERICADLDREIKNEQDKAGIHDPTHFAYPTYAKAATQRRDNLQRSIEDLTLQLNEAKAELAEALEELQKVESLQERDQTQERAEQAARSQHVQDDGALLGFDGAVIA